TFKTLCLLNYALMIRHDYDLTSSLRRGALHDLYELLIAEVRNVITNDGTWSSKSGKERFQEFANNSSVVGLYYQLDKLNYLEQPIPPAPVAPAGQYVAPEILAAHNAWIKGSKEIVGLMLMTMEPEIQRNLEPFHAYEMLRELKTLFAQQAAQELLQTTQDFHSCRQEEGQSVSSYVLKMKGYIENLEHLGNPVTLGLGVSLILIGLRKEYDGFMQNYNMHSMGKTVNELHAMLSSMSKLCQKTTLLLFMLFEPVKSRKVISTKKSQSQMAARGQNHGKGKNKQAYAPKPKIPLPPKREDPVKDSICHECGETRHWKRNCPQYLAELLKKKKNAVSGAGGSSIFVIELNTILNRSWIYDTGCGTHICNTTQGLRASRKLKPGALSLYVGNGQREAVEAIGAFHLCLPSGLEIILNNCHYAPSVTIEVIYVSHFAILRDGIFEIDLSNSYTNESSIYDVSNKRAKLDLDSALLWHCRLGHISKKRIEKFQHDRLLDSFDLRAFEKCVSCMSEKMERKHYTHQVKRAKDLLGLIHTDDYALETAARILNVVPTKKVEKAPYEVWHEKAPKLSYLKVWGCEALVKRDTLTKPDRLEPRSIECIFIGYPKETMGYSFYYPPESKVLVAWNAEFLENSRINQEASGSLEDLEIIQEEDTHPSIYTSLRHEDDDLEIDEPQSDIVPIRRSTKTQHAPYRMCLYIDAEEHELGDLGEPANYKAALLDPESEKWLNVMNVEIQSMKDNKVWVLVELPPNGKTICSKWIFKKKTDMDGVVHTYKARLMAKGYTQTVGIDYEETFSPVADIRAIRILIAIAA
nr:hypothetical protein [Tanacetum cinerariifolium]